MTPTFAAALLRALQAGRNLGPRGMPVTEERVTAALEAGFIEVNGRRIPVTGHGARGLRPGQKVAVAWQRGQPTVAIRHSARRTGPVSPQPQLAGKIVEELIRAPAEESSSAVDIWFRNGVAMGRLGINTTLGVSNVNLGANAWGLTHQHMAVGYPPDHWAVFTLGAQDGTPRDPDRIVDDVPIATLERDYNLRASTAVLGQYTTIYSSGTVTYNPTIVVGTLFDAPFGQPGYESVDTTVAYFGSVTDSMVDERGHLLLSIALGVSYLRFSVGFTLGATIPYIVDLTDDVVLYDGSIQCPALFGVPALDPKLINLDMLPTTEPPSVKVSLPNPSYNLYFLHADAGAVTLIAGASYVWTRLGLAAGEPPFSPPASMVKVHTPSTSILIQPYTLATGLLPSGPTDGIRFVHGLSAEYVFWFPFHRDGGASALTDSLPSPFGLSASGLVSMTRFVDPITTVPVATNLDAFFTPGLLFLEPTALYNTTNSNEDGHYFVEFLDPNGDVILDLAAGLVPDTRPGTEGGFLLDVPEEFAFVQAYLDDQSAPSPFFDYSGAEFTDSVLTGLTDYQLIPDLVAVRELPI